MGGLTMKLRKAKRAPRRETGPVRKTTTAAPRSALCATSPAAPACHGARNEEHTAAVSELAHGRTRALFLASMSWADLENAQLLDKVWSHERG
jgi:hypothetical protein